HNLRHPIKGTTKLLPKERLLRRISWLIIIKFVDHLNLAIQHKDDNNGEGHVYRRVHIKRIDDAWHWRHSVGCSHYAVDDPGLTTYLCDRPASFYSNITHRRCRN